MNWDWLVPVIVFAPFVWIYAAICIDDWRYWRRNK